jgi:hypothetical protein
MIIINEKKRKKEKLLFPGYGLNKPIKHYSGAAQIVGCVFEEISAKLIKGTLNQTDMTVDLCPDLTLNDYLIEVKATQRRHYFKVSIPQLERYQLAEEDEGGIQSPRKVQYHLWTYKQQHLSQELGTVGLIVEGICKSISYVTIFPIDVIKALRRTCQYGCRERSYNSWRNKRGDIWHVLQVTHAFMDEIRYDPQKALLMIDCTDDYQIRRWRSRSQRIRYQDVLFYTCGFDVLQIEKRQHPKPVELFTNPADEVPF